MAGFWRADWGLPPIRADRGEGGWLLASDGAKYFEASSGAINLNIGHSHRRVVEAICDQAHKLTFGSPSVVTAGVVDDLAASLLHYLGLEDYSVLLLGSGTDAVECAMMLARQYYVELGEPSRQRILTRTMSYHGASQACLGISGHMRRRRPYQEFLPPPPTVPAPYCYRCPMGLTPDSCRAECVEPFESALQELPEQVAAVMVEPVGGAAGPGIAPTESYYRTLRSICDKHGALYIADEVMCGLGRTGHATALSEWGVHPDILVVGKGLGAGYVEISAVVLGSRIRHAIEMGSGMLPLTHTLGGNPLAAAGALAVLDVYREEEVVSRVREGSETLRRALGQFRDMFDFVLDVRGRGYMLAVELAPKGEPGQATRVVRRLARESGLLMYPCNGYVAGGGGDGFFVAPPLNSSEEEIRAMLVALEQTLSRYARLGTGSHRGEACLQVV